MLSDINFKIAITTTLLEYRMRSSVKAAAYSLDSTRITKHRAVTYPSCVLFPNIQGRRQSFDSLWVLVRHAERKEQTTELEGSPAATHEQSWNHRKAWVGRYIKR